MIFELDQPPMQVGATHHVRNSKSRAKTSGRNEVISGLDIMFNLDIYCFIQELTPMDHNYMTLRQSGLLELMENYLKIPGIVEKIFDDMEIQNGKDTPSS